jgi:hypothetical protein
MKDAPAFDFYPERWLAGVAMLSDAEQLAFLRLLCQQWLAGDDGLPADLALLKRAAGKGVTAVLLDSKFPLCDDGRRRNAKLERIRSEQRARISKKSEQRRAAALRRWHPEQSESNATAMRPHESRTMRDDAKAMPTTHHPPHSIHSHSAHDAWPDPSEYPKLEEVQSWSRAVMAPPECAEKWHAERVAEGWQNRHGIPMTSQRAALSALFRSYATAWKANDARRKAPAPKPMRPADTSDVQPSNLREL